MKKWSIIIGESLVLGLLYSFPFAAPYYWLTFVAFYACMGIIHGIVFQGNIAKGVGAAIVVGALSGVWVTATHLNTIPAGESVFFWFLAGVFINVLVYSLRPSTLLMYPIVALVMKLHARYIKKSEIPKEQ